MRDAYHIRLNGSGYLLATDQYGGLVSGASRTQMTDPFMHYVSRGNLWKRERFTFEAGAGATRVDGSRRYRRGMNIDTRGGNLILAPEVTICQQATDLVERVSDGGGNLIGIEISTESGDKDGYAIQISIPSGKTQIKSVAVLVKRDAATDYAGANAFTINLHANATDRPGSSVATANVSLVNAPGNTWGWVCDPWLAHKWVWIVGHFASPVSVVPGGVYWLSIINDQTPKVIWGADASGSRYTSEYNGSSWTARSHHGKTYYKINFYDEIDAPAVCFEEFRGDDNVRRLYAGVGRKVMYWDVATSRWAISKGDFDAEITDMCLFKEELFVAQGADHGLAHLDGASPTGTWTVLANWQGQALALHDNLLWAARGADLNASPTGHDSGWGAGIVTVGDPGTLITRMISHGGKLYCFKEEGVYEISYPETYPDSGKPSANMIHDFRTARAARAFALDWHSGAYFPGEMGLYEWRGGVLRDIWASRIEPSLERELARPSDIQQYVEAGVFQAIAGTTNGLWAAVASPFLKRSAIWYYRNQAWHPIYQMDSYQGEYIRALHYESLGGGEGRLWFSLGHDIAYMEIPSWTDDRTLDEDATFATGGELELPRFDDGDATLLKQFCGVAVVSKGASASNKVRVWYQIDQPKASDTWSLLGEVTSSPYTELPFTEQTGYSIRLKLELIGTGSSSVVVEEATLLFQPLPDTITQHQVTVRLADYAENLNGTPDDRTAGQVWQDLADLLEETLPWTYRDELGVEHTVRATGLTKSSLRTMDETGAPRIEAVAMLQMLEVGCGQQGGGK